MRNLILIACLACSPVHASEFAISGLKIGATVQDKDALGLCPAADDGAKPECLSIFDHAGGEVLVTYYFDGSIFTGATIIFDSKKFSKFVSYYEKQFGAKPAISKSGKEIDGDILSNKTAVWEINGMRFVVEKYKSYKRGLAYLES